MKFMNKKTKQFFRFVSLLLVVTLLAGSIPESVYAKNGNSKSTVTKEYTEGDMVYSYIVESAWGNSVSAKINIENHSKETLDNWQIVLFYDGIIDNIWNGEIVSNEDGKIVICAKDYNKTIKAGKSVSFGFIAHGENSQPKMPEKIVSYETDRNQGVVAIVV